MAAIRHGDVITAIQAWAKADTMETTGRVKGIMEGEPGATAVVDVIGIGAGVYDRLREQGIRSDPFNAGRKTTRKDQNRPVRLLQSAAIARLVDAQGVAEPPHSKLALPPDDELVGDLTALHYSHTSDGKIRVEGKDDIRKRIGRSTDRGDAVISFLLSSGSWADAYGTTTCVNEKCGRPFMREANGKPRTECPFCHTPLDEPEGEAA